jgi:aminoglycoside 6'-N-acetyltransferase
MKHNAREARRNAFENRGADGLIKIKRSMDEITFRLLERSDLPLLQQWLNAPHMRSFYQPEPVTLEEVSNKYSPRIEGIAPTFCHLALVGEQRVGKIQCYRNIDWPDYASEIGLSDGVSIDYFIGEPSFLKRGFGRGMVTSYLRDVVPQIFEHETRCYVCHDKTNIAAIKCSEAAGFQFLRNVIEIGKPMNLYFREVP